LHLWVRGDVNLRLTRGGRDVHIGVPADEEEDTPMRRVSNVAKNGPP